MLCVDDDPDGGKLCALFLMDLELPRLDGWATTRALKSDARARA